MPIPSFDHNLVLPPHLGNPTEPGQLSPYPCTTSELCRRFGTTPERREILLSFLDFRGRIRAEGLLNGIQWLDGSFLEDVETREKRSPQDLDVVTIFWGYDLPFLKKLASNFPEFASPTLSKAKYRLDHYNFDASFNPRFTVEQSRYWAVLFSHNRQGVWKGMLRLEIDTAAEDAIARMELAEHHS